MRSCAPHRIGHLAFLDAMNEVNTSPISINLLHPTMNKKGAARRRNARSGAGASLLNFTRRVYAVVARIPKGRTLTYREVARRAGIPKAYRAVGNILNKNPDPKRIPCHRVIRSDGTLGGYAWGKRKKRTLLRREGIC